jgi:hypothetical protein
MLATLNSKSFRECLDSLFEMATPAGTAVPLVLVEVQEGSNTRQIENFSLFFRGPVAPFFPQAIYRLNHATLGTVDLFLVPVGPDGKGMQYEAVFNRFRDSA